MYPIPDITFDLDGELDKTREFYRNRAIPADALARMDQQTEELVGDTCHESGDDGG